MVYHRERLYSLYRNYNVAVLLKYRHCPKMLPNVTQYSVLNPALMDLLLLRVKIYFINRIFINMPKKKVMNDKFIFKIINVKTVLAGNKIKLFILKKQKSHLLIRKLKHGPSEH